LAESLEARALLSSTPAMVADIVPGATSSDPGNLVAIGSTIYFTANDGIHGYELWKSNGTAAGTMMLKDINSGGGGSYAGSLTNVNGTLYFGADDGVHGSELWKSDGTAAGTTLVADINPGAGSSDIGSPTDVNGTLFFSANDGAHGPVLFKSDGTAGGTTMVKAIWPRDLINVNGTLFFREHGIYGLWKSDGTETGTVQVSSATGGQLTNVNGTLFFNGWDVTGAELWKSDGTAAGTTLVKDIYPGSHIEYYSGNYGGQYSRVVVNSSDPSALTVRNGTLFFSADDGAHGRGLWKSDGTAGGTVMVSDAPVGVSSRADGLTNVNGTLYFAASDTWNEAELWKSDGTAAGTTMVKLIPGSVFFGSPRFLTNVNGTLYFIACDTDHAAELWKSDGTTAGTTMVMDILPGSYYGYYGSYYPKNLTNANGALFFTASDGVHGTELWALNVIPAPSLGLSFPTTTTAGSASSLTITARNADGTTNTGYLGTVHFTSTDPQAVLPADYTFTAADHGVHAFTGKLKTAGSQSITAIDTHAPDMDGTLRDILVKAAAASTMTVGGFPSYTWAGNARDVTVTLKDIYGNIASGYAGTVRFTSSDAQAALPASYTFTAADAGIHTFSVTLKTAGTRSITVVDTLMSALTATQGTITVYAGAASQFLISAPSSVKSDVAFSLTLTVKDAYGNVVTDYTGTVRFTSTDKTANLPTNYTFTAADHGVHTFTGLVLRKKGIQKITIIDTLNSSLTASVVENVN
jgi:ELWxxDGT repeat protein